MPSLFNRNQTGSEAAPPEKHKVPPPPPPPPPAPPTLPLSPALEQAAKDFKKLFTDNNAAYHLIGGQGAVTRAMREVLVPKVWAMSADALKNELVSLIQGNGATTMKAALMHSEVRLGQKTKESLPASDPDSWKLAGVLRTKSIVNTTRTYKETTATARRLLEDPAVSAADRALALEVLDDKTATGAWSWATLDTWMAAPLGPVTFDKVSLPRLLALFLNGTVQCAPIAGATARKLLKVRGVADSAVPAFGGATLTGVTQKDSRSTPINLILNYNPTQLANVMNSVRTVLSVTNANAGYLVAGCLSGEKWEEKEHPALEHFIMLFAADNDAALFWDPAASAATHIREFGDRLGPGIGLLYYDHADPAKPKWSTGVDFTDLFTLEGRSGDHLAHRTRHRYQIQTVAKPS
jgi:hypothetical protein